MSEQPAHDGVARLEYDETILPRPEEEIADAARSAPDDRAPGRPAPRDVADGGA